MRPFKVADEVFWVGAIDPQLRVFDILMRTENGTTYNAYLVRGSQKVALIDTVKAKYLPQLLSNLEELGGLGQVNYIVLNHTEPDHAGALDGLIKDLPEIQVIASSKAEVFLRNLIKRDINFRLVNEGESIDLGGERMRFISAPFLHWPDTMFTYLERTKVLITCDFLGSHYCDDRFFNDLINDFGGAFKYYFSTIIRPFKKYVLEAISKVEDLDIEMIAPGHGPILRKDFNKYIDLYRKWSTEEPKYEKLLLILYASAYGNTTLMAESIARGVKETGVDVRLYNLAEVEPVELIDEVERADCLLVGSPTINNDAVKPVWDLLASLATIRVQGKKAAAFGSFVWSGQAPKLIEERLAGLRFKIAEPYLRIQFVPSGDELKKCEEFGIRIANSLKNV